MKSDEKAQMKNWIGKCLALAVYSAVILVLVWNHEYWFDEGQAWNIARDNDILGIISMAKFEGHPPLWHFILKIFTAAGASWRALGLISWFIASVTAGVIIFALPAKPYLKAALLLSSGMLYYNSVIARVYGLIYLILALIAWIYPQRERRPVLFGILVALLANTHVCMCGLVGIIGLFMIADIIKDWKNNDAKRNLRNLAGLAIAGIGVILLVLPLMGSIGTNAFTAGESHSLWETAYSFIMAFTNIVFSSCAENIPLVPGMILSTAAQFAIVMYIVFVRKQKKTLTMILFFSIFYMIIVEVIWYTTPCRGALYVFALVMVYIMGRDDKVTVAKTQREFRTDTVLGSNIISVFKRFDGKTDATVSILLAAALAVSVPVGVVNAVRDLTSEFSPAKGAAEFIAGNIPEDALIVTVSDSFSEVLAYLPGRELFSIEYGRFYTYCSHETPPESMDFEAFYAEADKYDKVYLLNHYDVSVPAPSVYSNENYIEFDIFDAPINISVIEASQYREKINAGTVKPVEHKIKK